MVVVYDLLSAPRVASKRSLVGVVQQSRNVVPLSKLDHCWGYGLVLSDVDSTYGGIVCGMFLDNSTKENGSTRIIPKSHKKLGWPGEHINIYKKSKHEIRPVIKAGSIIIANLNLWHAGGLNISGKKRRVIFLNIKRRSLPQLLNYKKFLSKKTKNKLNEVQKYLLAIRNSDKTQKENSVGVGHYYKGDFHIYSGRRRQHKSWQ